MFTVCNLYGMTGTLLFDRVHDTRYGLDQLDRFDHFLENEFNRCDGTSVVIASRRTGLVIVGASPYLAQSNCWLMNMVSPRQAQVAWTLARDRLIERTGGDLSLVEPKGAELIDAGTYRPTGCLYWASLMTSAAEMGDDELYRIAEGRFDDLAAKSDTYAGLFSTAQAAVGRFGAEGTWHRFANGEVPAATTQGPRLAQVPYSAADVAYATNDGAVLSAVLRPHGTPTGVVPVGFSGLAPGRLYRLDGPGGSRDLTADHSGRAHAEILLEGRAGLSLSPQP